MSAEEIEIEIEDLKNKVGCQEIEIERLGDTLSEFKERLRGALEQAQGLVQWLE